MQGLRRRSKSHCARIEAKSYRPKFLLSYAFVVLRSIVPNSSINEIDALARLYTSYGPAPRTLFQELTGAAEHCQDAGFVAFARKLRNALALDFRLDLKLYSVQYLPCMFDRACPALVMARAQEVEQPWQTALPELWYPGNGKASTPSSLV